MSPLLTDLLLRGLASPFGIAVQSEDTQHLRNRLIAERTEHIRAGNNQFSRLTITIPSHNLGELWLVKKAPNATEPTDEEGVDLPPGGHASSPP